MQRLAYPICKECLGCCLTIVPHPPEVHHLTLMYGLGGFSAMVQRHENHMVISLGSMQDV
jgi:hypothetical protein